MRATGFIGRCSIGPSTLLVVGLFALVGCAGTPTQPEPAADLSVPDLAAPDWLATAPTGRTYQIDPSASHLKVTVRRAGWLKFLGHNHVLSNRSLQGWVWTGAAGLQGRAGVRADVNGFEVDPAELRAGYGPEFGAQPGAADIAATRRNLLGPRVLDAASYPHLSGRAEFLRWLGPERARFTLTLAVKSHLWHGEIDADVRESTSSIGSVGRVDIVGEVTLTHRELGLRPISVLAGAISVAQPIDIRLELVAWPAQET